MKKECLWAWVAFVLFFGGLMLLSRFVDRWTYGAVLFGLWLAGGVWWSSNESISMGKRILLLPLHSMTALMHLAICWTSLLLGASWPKE